MKTEKKSRKAALVLTLLVPALIVLCLLSFGGGSARAEFGWADPALIGAAPVLPPVVELGDIAPSFTFAAARYATGGVALRNQQEGAITLSGIPPGSTILSAQLYWMWASLTTPSALHSKIGFYRLSSRRTLLLTVNGIQVGSGLDPCWLGGSNFVYRADVTTLVTGSGVYGVSLLPGSAGKFDGSDPWTGAVAPLAEGAALVVVYKNSAETMGQVNIYDKGLAGNMFSQGLSYELTGLPPNGILYLWDTIGGDGQIGASRHATTVAAQETTTIDGNLIAGPGSVYNDSDWNGSSGRPLPQLWDVHGHQVDLPIDGDGDVEVVFTAHGDCLVPVANVTLAFTD